MAKKKKNKAAVTEQPEEKPETPETDKTEDSETPESQELPAAESGEVVTEAEESATSAEDESGGDTEESVEDVETEVGDDLATQLEAVRAESARNLENWQRTAAELANFKRRQEEQMKLQRDRIKSEVLEGVISALDDMDLAFQNLPEELGGQLVGWVEGFRLVQRKLDRILDEQNVMVIKTEGQFDPNYHEAVSYEDHNDHDTDEIIAELRKGYQIGSRVIRPALVRVAK